MAKNFGGYGFYTEIIFGPSILKKDVYIRRGTHICCNGSYKSNTHEVLQYGYICSLRQNTRKDFLKKILRCHIFHKREGNESSKNQSYRRRIKGCRSVAIKVVLSWNYITVIIKIENTVVYCRIVLTRVLFE